MSILERKRTLRRAAIFTDSPVRGFLPTLSDTEATENTPNPEITTFSPLSNVDSVKRKRVSTTDLTSVLEADNSSAIALINCDLFVILCLKG